MFTIFDFLSTGKINFIELGIEKSAIMSRLGEPEGVSNSKKTTILKYGSLQLTFRKDIPAKEAYLDSIHIYFDEEVVLPRELALSGYIPGTNTIQRDFFEQTRNAKITLLEDKQHSFVGLQEAYKSEVGVIVIFNVEYSSDKLASIHLAKR